MKLIKNEKSYILIENQVKTVKVNSGNIRECNNRQPFKFGTCSCK